MKTIKEYQEMIKRAAKMHGEQQSEIAFLKTCMNKLKSDYNDLQKDYNIILKYVRQTNELENLYKNALRENRLLKEKYENN